jgi:UDP-N-acetylglucosamine 1-carboxyvinyltransferase
LSYILIDGGRPLHGRSPVQGSKNVALHLYAATLLMPGPAAIRNAPAILDTGVCAQIVTELGKPTRYTDGSFVASADFGLGWEIRPELGRRIRPTACFAAAVLARGGRVRFPMPGGDGFCERPIDLHLRAMELAGAALERRPGGIIDAKLPGGRPAAFTMSLDTPWGPSLGATVTAIFLAATAWGTSVLTEVSIEPEVLHTIDYLNRSGAQISMLPGHRCEVIGVPGLGTADVPVDVVVPPDRLEAGTLALAALVTGGQVVLAGTDLTDLTPAFAEVLARMGVEFSENADGLLVRAKQGLAPADVVTGPHPEFPTDLQPQTTCLLTQVPGRSTVIERVYTQRATHLEGLRAFGADIEERGNMVLVNGGGPVRPADVEALDIRCCTALLLAALAAPGESRITGLYHLDRGHGGIVGALSGLGASITRVNSTEELVDSD